MYGHDKHKFVFEKTTHLSRCIYRALSGMKWVAKLTEVESRLETMVRVAEECCSCNLTQQVRNQGWGRPCWLQLGQALGVRIDDDEMPEPVGEN